jgi:hydroxylaminobenzene mutase
VASTAKVPAKLKEFRACGAIATPAAPRSRLAMPGVCWHARLCLPRGAAAPAILAKCRAAMNLRLLRYGFILVLISLVLSFFIPAMAVPRLALSAHTIGIMSGILMILVGAIWPVFGLGPAQAATMQWCWVYSGYANWLGCLVGAVTGASRMTPIAAGTSPGPFVAETLVSVLLVTTGLTALVAAGLSVWGLREKALRTSPARQRRAQLLR